MAFRKFVDREGHEWDVRPRSRSEWDLEPAGMNPGKARSVASPGYEKDPYELSKEELQVLLDQARPPKARDLKNPFAD